MKTTRFIFLFCMLLVNNLFSQETPIKNKILFIVDYSGSMQAHWGAEKKYIIARNVLFQLADSLQQSNSDLEIAVRVFGHQSTKGLEDCLDSKLEIDFSNNNASEIKLKFEEIVAQGNTPIAYSLEEAAKDFSKDSLAINSIILITDGLENCEGNPCDVALALKQKRVSINPYIIGLDIASSLIEDFDCIGTFVNASDEKTFKKVLDDAVKTVTKKTSVEINLLSQQNKLISNTAISLYNHFTGELIYNFIHALDKYGKADTIYLDPRGVFDVVVHTFPALEVKNIELQTGIHNIINIELLKGKIDFHYKKAYDDKKIDYILRDRFDGNVVYSSILKNKYFLSNKYNLSVLSYPMVEDESKNVPIEKAVHQFIKENGSLVIDLKKQVLISLFTKEGDLVKDFGLLAERTMFKLQPGKYILVYIDKNTTKSENTIRKNIEIESSKTVLIN